jgi:tetratricopeptide (TPR) repeat protein
VVDELRPPTFDILAEAVRTGGYHALHFYGHGVYHEGAGHLLFEDPYGGPQFIKADDVGAVLNNSDVRLVVMGACQSAMGGADRWSSAAAAMLRAGVPLVVGMQVSMGVDAAQAFTRQFYLSLAAGKDVAQAMGDARLPLRPGTYGQTWFIPALYSRARSGMRLFDPTAPRAVDAELVTQLRGLHAEVERLEEEMSGLGVIDSPGELAGLRAAQKKLRQAQTAMRRATPGDYTPVISPLYGVPPQNPHFVGRVEALREVAQGMEGELPVVIWGLDGIGKTALAIEVVRRQSWRYPGGVLWLDCRGGPPFDSLLNQMGAFCGHPEVETMKPEKRQATVRVLLASLDHCLLVWDNAEAVWGQRAVRRFIETLPQNCGSLITTRDDPEQAGWPTVELPPLPSQSMTALFWVLGTAAGIKAVADDLPLVSHVLDWLEGHPLALTLAVPMAKKRGLKRLWAELQRQPLKGVDATLRVSFERLTGLQQHTFTHLSVLTIPFEYPVAEALLPGEETVDEAVDVLVQRALLSFDGRRYAYHALVRQFAYEELQKGEDDWRVSHRRAAEYLNAKARDEGITPAEALEEVDQWERGKAWREFAESASALVGLLDRHGYWPEIERQLARALEATRAHLDDIEMEAALLGGVARMAHRQAEWDRAIEMYQRSLEIDERMGDVHGMVGTWVNLGVVYADKGEWERAIEVYQRCLETFERVGDMHGMAKTWVNLGSVYIRRGEWERAIEMYESCLETFECVGDVHGMAQTFNNLGNVYLQKGKWDQAIEVYQRSLETFERVGDVHGMAQTWTGLGSVYTRKGEWKRAIKMYQHSLETFEHLGDVHGMAQTFNNLGSVYYRKDKWERAIEMHQRSLETFERVGDVHGMAQTFNNLGMVYTAKGEGERAIKMYQHSLEIDERVGDVHGMAQTFNNLGVVYADKGEWERAVEMYQRSLETKERVGDVYGMAKTWGNLGLLYKSQGDKEKAAEYLAQAYLVLDQLGAAPAARQAASGLVRVLGSVEAANAYLECLAASQGRTPS